MTATKIQVRETKEIKLAIYAPNKKGNKQYNVDGKFYTDKDFDKNFKIIQDELNKKAQ